MMEIQGESSFRVNAYRRGAQALESLQEDVARLRDEERLREVPGIGEGMAARIVEFLDTGRVSQHDDLLKKVPEGLLELRHVGGLGPKTLAMLHDKLKITGREDLVKALEAGKLDGLPGMGEKKIENLKKNLAFQAEASGRVALGVAWPMIEEIMELLGAKVKVMQLSPAGSLRRMRETVGDLDLLAATTRPEAALEAFVKLPMVQRVLGHGDTKASVVMEGGLQVDLRAVPPESYGAALQYFTGSREHNVRLREMARKVGLKINEYGVFKGEERVAGDTEESVYASLGLPWIPPEMREDRGEIDAALENRLPKLIELSDMRADLHCHTKASDGELTIEQLADEAIKRGYKYAAVTDHSASAGYAGGLQPARLLKHIEAIHAFNKTQNKIHLLAGTESDIRADGSLDYPDELLARLDWVVASIHSSFTKDPTGRLIKALEHPATCVLGHPTGRLILEREGYEVDWDALFQAAVRTGKAIEINANYHRLDLDDVRARQASGMGIPILINTDMHRADNFDQMKFGIGVARRAWLTAADVVNTWEWKKFEAWRKKVKRD